MSSVNDGGPAFASSYQICVNNSAELKVEGTWANGINIPPPNEMFHECGMSLRDYFAAKALSGILADPNSGPEVLRPESQTISRGHSFANHVYYKLVAESCYKYADAMLAAREVKP